MKLRVFFEKIKLTNLTKPKLKKRRFKQIKLEMKEETL